MSEKWKEWEGRIVGKFRLGPYLGGSGHSAVYLTELEGREPFQAAIKLLPAGADGGELQFTRWKRTASLSHPHLLKLFEWGRAELDGVKLLYVVTEHAEENLSQILPLRALTAEEARQFIDPALDALTYLRRQGLVHGRIQPSNILAAQDQLKLSIDGVVKTGETIENAGAYVAPETAQGTALPAGDLWSLAMVLVEALTQRLPAWDRGSESGPPVPPNMPGPFFDIARHCLRVDPQRRWTVTEIAERLRAPLITRSLVPEPKLQLTATPKWKYVVPVAAVALGGALFVALKAGHPTTEISPAPATITEPRSEARMPAPAAAAKPKPGLRQSNAPERSAVAIPPKPQAPAPIAAQETKSIPGVVEKVLPAVPQSARDTITGKIRVTVKLAVDRAGNVTDATLDTPGPSRYFARLALEAAQKWKFVPAQINGQNVPSEWNVRFAFGRESTDTFSSRTAPR